MSDGDGALPEGWAEATLGDLGEWKGGGTPSKSNSAFWTNGNVPWVSPKDMKRLYLDDAEDRITEDAVKNSSAQLFPPDSVLVVTRSGILQRILPVAINHVPVATNQDLKTLLPTAGIDPRYVAYLLKARDQHLRDECSKDGTTVASIDLPKLKAYGFGLAPEAEQRRIVSKIESLQERSSRAREALSDVGPLLAQFRQSVLRAAFSGRLTADWRAQRRMGTPARPSSSTEDSGKSAQATYETAHELLARIRTERRHRWEQAELAKYEAKGKQPPKNWQDKYKVETELDLTGLAALPEGWKYARADEIVEPGTVITYGIVLPGPHVDDGIPYIRGQDIEDGRILVDQLLRTTPEIDAKHARSTVTSGDVLLCVIRHLKVALVPDGIDGVNLTQGTVRMRPSAIINGPFLAHYLAGPVGQEWMKRRHFGLAMPRINVADARAVPIPIAPLEEQLEIVKQVHETLASWEQITAGVAESESALTQLDQSILAKAFRGELVPQDPHDEPASELLARIRQQRAEDSGSRVQSSAKSSSRNDVPNCIPGNKRRAN